MTAGTQGSNVDQSIIRGALPKWQHPKAVSESQNVDQYTKAQINHRAN